MSAGRAILERLGFVTLPVSSQTPLPNDVELYLVDVQRSAVRLGAPDSLLSAAERRRAERIVVPAGKRRFVTTRAALRVLLGGRLDISPLAVRFAYGAYGKPRTISAQKWTFNVSHSGGLALIALRRGAEVGVDIQQVEAHRDWQGLLKAVCEPQDHRRLLAESRRRGPVTFFERWVASEALLKAEGTGLLGALSQDGAAYCVSPLTVPEDYVAAIALHQSSASRSRAGHPGAARVGPSV